VGHVPSPSCGPPQTVAAGDGNEVGLDREAAIERAAEARVGRLATVRPDGTPHVVPFVFVLVRDGTAVRLYWTVDAKPKRSTSLRRVENLRANPAVEVVVDRYDDEWTGLWWVRMRGTGRVVTSAEERRTALTALASKYPAYRSMRAEGDVVAIEVEAVSWWSAEEDLPSPPRPAR
jgi:PPOX class probable F420-dependent enzyme